MAYQLNPKSQMFIPSTKYGVCVWEIDGSYLSDGNGFLSLEGVMNDPKVEHRMREAAYYWLDGEKIGKPTWLPDARKITNDEWEDQKARLEAGMIPDPVDAVRQMMEK